MKIAIFVEGNTELAFVREFLLRYYEFDNIAILCQELRGGSYSGVDYDYPNNDAFYDEDNLSDKYLIVDCGGDSITSKIIEKEKHLLKSNIEGIIGLRDVYCLDFKTTISHIFDRELVKEYISFNVKTLSDETQSDIAKLCFAIMEIESWYLGMTTIFSKKSDLLTPDIIMEKCNNSDPEELFKPSKIMDEIFSLTGDRYKKKKKQASSLSNYPDRNHFIELYNSNSCTSFNHFFDTLNFTVE